MFVPFSSTPIGVDKTDIAYSFALIGVIVDKPDE